MDLVSVLLPLYREPLSVAQCAIESILRQSYEKLEILLLLDDPSNKDLCSLIKSYAESDARVKAVVNEHNLGIVDNLNQGIDLSTGDYICRMDADDIADIQRIEIQVNTLNKDNLDLIGGEMDVVDEAGCFQYSVQLPLECKHVNQALRWNNCVPHPTWLGKRSVFQKKYRNFPFCEDYDFLLRSLLAGERIGNCGFRVLQYRMGSDSLSRSNLFKQFIAQRYLTSSFRKNTLPSIEEAWNEVEGCSSSKEQGYLKANVAFNEAVANLHNKRIVAAVLQLLKIPLLSWSYLDKISRLAIASSYRFKENVLNR